MDQQVEEYIGKYPRETVELYRQLRQLVFACAAREPQETLWARMPSYVVGEAFVRLIPFKDHINIEAQAVNRHKEALAGYKITPKGMLQVYIGQAVPCEALKQIFAETLA